MSNVAMLMEYQTKQRNDGEKKGLFYFKFPAHNALPNNNNATLKENLNVYCEKLSTSSKFQVTARHFHTVVQ